MPHATDELALFRTFRAYARAHTGELLASGTSRRAQLIHMSRYDARLRLLDGVGSYVPGLLLELQVSGKAGRGEPLRARASVHWVDKNEVGLLFACPLELGTRELQSFLD